MSSRYPFGKRFRSGWDKASLKLFTMLAIIAFGSVSLLSACSFIFCLNILPVLPCVSFVFLEYSGHN